MLCYDMLCYVILCYVMVWHSRTQKQKRIEKIKRINKNKRRIRNRRKRTILCTLKTFGSVIKSTVDTFLNILN